MNAAFIIGIHAKAIDEFFSTANLHLKSHFYEGQNHLFQAE